MKIFKSLIILMICLPTIFSATSKDDQLRKKAEELAHKYIIVDTHVDVPYRIIKSWQDISKRTASGDFDYERAKKGGLDSPFMSVYIPARMENNGAKEFADSLIDLVESFQNKWPDKFAVAYSVMDIQNQFKKDLISLPMGMENGSPIEGDLENISYFYGRGIRYITLCHSKDNHICDSSYDTARTWKGLSQFGEEVIAEMNRIGMMIDVSHVSDDTFYDIMKLSKAPVIASHSACRYYTPGFERNMSDEMIKALAENGGVIQMNFGSYFIMGDFQKKIKTAQDYLKSQKISTWSPEGKKYIANYMKENNISVGYAKDIAKHIDRVVKLTSINNIGFGSDFDGVGDLPVGVKDVSGYPNVIYELLKMGYSEQDIEKICSGNIFRVWREVDSMKE